MGEVGAVGVDGVGVEVDGCEGLDAGLLEAEGEAAGAGE